MDTAILYCPKCDGRRIKGEPIAATRTQMISLDELADKQVVEVAMRKPLVLEAMGAWVATCEDCGYAVEFRAPVAFDFKGRQVK